MSLLKLLLVIDGLWVGGTERSLAETLPYLSRFDITPIIACFYRYPEEGVEQEVMDQGFDVRFLAGAGRAGRVWALRRLIQAEQPDLIHTALFKANLTGRLAAFQTATPLLNSLTNTAYAPVRFQDPHLNKRRLRLVQVVDGWTARHLATHFHAVSNAVKDSAIETLRLPPERITVVERGRDPNRLGQPGPARKRRARQQLDLSDTDEVLVNMGRHEYQKGQTYLLKAMAALKAEHPRLVLVIPGRSGHASAELARLQDQLGLAGRVHFLDHRDDAPDVLAAADIFVFPSLYEGLPGAVIEAMALGLPVVASDIKPVREVVEPGRNALLAPPASIEELAGAIRSLLKDRAKAAAFGERSRAIFESRFTLEQSVSRMAALYHRLAR